MPQTSVQIESVTHATLDLFSTSQTNLSQFPATALQERLALNSPCQYNAPFFAYPTQGKTWRVTQGNCHHWDCARCGLSRAKQEYGRMVEGCRALAQDHSLFFITITCKGREESWQHAEENYLKRTNVLLTACRTQSKRKNLQWHYVQVTERQKRKHPHSHFITTYCPPDSKVKTVSKWTVGESGRREWKSRDILWSDWFGEQVIKSGLGAQYEITQVRQAEAASRYVAKYLFKSEMFTTDFPPNWKRVRYAQSFPKLPVRETDAFVLLSRDDWTRLANLAVVVQCEDVQSRGEAEYFLAGSSVLVTKIKPKRYLALLNA